MDSARYHRQLDTRANALGFSTHIRNRVDAVRGRRNQTRIATHTLLQGFRMPRCDSDESVRRPTDLDIEALPELTEIPRWIKVLLPYQPGDTRSRDLVIANARIPVEALPSNASRRNQADRRIGRRAIRAAGSGALRGAHEHIVEQTDDGSGSQPMPQRRQDMPCPPGCPTPDLCQRVGVLSDMCGERGPSSCRTKPSGRVTGNRHPG